MTATIRTLLVEDNPVNAALVRGLLARDPAFTLTTATTLAASLSLLESACFDAALVDLHLPDSVGLDTFRRIFELRPELAVVILTGTEDESAALSAVQLGAQDYLVKGRLDDYGLVRALRYAVERKRAQEDLRASQERYALVAQGVNDGLWDWNLEDGALYLSPRWKALIGFADEDLANEPATWLDRVHPEDRAAVDAALNSAVNGDSNQIAVEYRLADSGGAYRWMLCRGAAVRNRGGRAARLAGSQTDITDSKLYDRLTSLPNRQLFMDRLQQACRRLRSGHLEGFGLLYINIDRFQLINQSFGPLAADRILAECAARLSALLAPDDTLARFTGDEFALIAENIASLEALSPLIERIRLAFQTPFLTGADEVFLRLSGGCVFAAPGAGDAAALLSEAQATMQRARAAGGDRFELLGGAVAERMRERMRLESSLRRAIERDELYLLYQPQFEIRTGRLIGFEALVRWRHPELGELSPAQFIPIAEESNLIDALGVWTLRTALKQAAAWLHNDAPLRVAVNVSARQFATQNLPALVAALLAETGTPPGLLELECTESVAIDGPDSAHRTLTLLTEMGVRTAIDDFGTGYSSLTYLKRLPVQAVKIDREFVRPLPGDRESAAIVSAILTLCQELGLETVAEGVETPEQLEWLALKHCDIAQGFHLGRPLSAAEATRLGAHGRQASSVDA